MAPTRRRTPPHPVSGSRSRQPIEAGRRRPTGLITETPGMAIRERPGPAPAAGLRSPVSLLMVIALAGLVVALARGGDQASALSRPSGDLAACPAVINTWARQRLDQQRQVLEREHSVVRSDGEAPNAVIAAMRWLDDRIIDHYLERERDQIRAMTRASSRCLPMFTPGPTP